MIAEPKFVVDKIEGIEIDHRGNTNQISMLQSLRNGLALLYNTCKQTENKVFEDYNGKVSGYNVPGKTIDLTQLYYVLPCYFHWFSVSAANYARLAGYMVGKERGEFKREDVRTKEGKKKIKESCNRYVDGVKELEQVLLYRNKVSAHFALTDPRNEDNYVTMDFSVLAIAGFSSGKLASKPVEKASFQKDGTAIVDEIPNWSITMVFEEMAKRYWPDIVFPPDIMEEKTVK